MLDLLHIDKKFSRQSGVETVAVSDINLSIKTGEFISLLGPSGCGKSTLLRLISGLETPTKGEIKLNGLRIDHMSAQQRPFHMVFQKYALFPHMTVFENIEFGLRVRKISSDQRRARVNQVLTRVGLSDYASRLPETLSGGQAQRVAVARALVNEPQILLLDEPLAALDLKMREHLQIELRDLQKKLGLTFIYVTHDQDEALAMSDRIVVMSAGHIEQIGTPQEIYKNPTSEFVAGFIGSMKKLNGKILTSGEYHTVDCGEGIIISGKSKSPLNKNQKVSLFVRPEVIRLAGLGSDLSADQSAVFEKSNSSKVATNSVALINKLEANLRNARYRGFGSELTVELNNGQRLSLMTNKELTMGSYLNLEFLADDVLIFPSIDNL